MIRTWTLLLALFCTAFNASAISVWLETRPETCFNGNGKVFSTVSGGTMPYTYAWTGPNGFTSTADSLFNVGEGTYNVTVTDFVGATATGSAMVEGYTQLPPGSGPTYGGVMELTGYWGGACMGQCNGAGAFVEHLGAGTPPFSYDFDVPVQYLGTNTQSELGGEVYTGFCWGELVNYSFTDALGCPGTGSFTVYGVDASWFPSVQEVQGACTGQQNGSITVLPGAPIPSTLTLSLNGIPVATQNGAIGQPYTFSGLSAGDHVLDVAISSTICTGTQVINVPDLGPNCGNISGMSWYDSDGDCVNDAGEVGVPNSVLAIEPGGYYAITHADGTYSLNLPAGNFTLEQTDASLIPICPATQPVPFTINSTPVVQDLANGSTTALDLSLYASSSLARPGFGYALHGHVSNVSPQVSGPVTLTCTYDPTLAFVNATPAPTSVVGNTITWDYAAFGSFGASSVHVLLNIPASTPLGSILSSTFTASNTLPESTLANNTEVLNSVVTGSYDPNVKEVRTSSQESRTQYFIGTDNYLDYTIQFQNTGTDTAFTVVVTDTLDAALDMGRFEQGVSSHPCTVDFLPGRVVRWTFNNILLVDSTTNEAASHGLTSFRIRLHEPVLPGVFITNNADIFFDFNDPIRAPDVSVVTETSTGVNASTQDALMLHPNPSTGNISITGHALVNVNVMDLSGREVFNLQMPPTDVVRCDLSELPSGMYAVRVRTNDGAVNTLRVVLR